MKPNKLTYFLFTVVGILIFTGCGMKPGSSGKSSKFFETFYAGSKNGTQYFIKPLDFADADKQGAAVDFTLRDADFQGDSTTVNYTLTTSRQLPADQAISFVDANGKSIFQTRMVERLFQERTKTGYLARYTSKAPNPAVASAFEQTDMTLRVFTEGEGTLIFLPSGKTQSAMQEVNRNLFSLY
ncbi:hypothetical protein CEQ90_08130 [Lewinellaceae bacterium SD302]|nr:hypothetical protein CEQ90_08130 [Lewinellaceae bacterium SD302]